MGPPNGLSRVALSTSTWIHWWSPVASANRSTRSWVTSNQSLVPSAVPTAARSSSSDSNTVCAIVILSSGPGAPGSRVLGADAHDLAGHVRRVVAGEEGDNRGDLPRLGGKAEPPAPRPPGQQTVP